MSVEQIKSKLDELNSQMKQAIGALTTEEAFKDWSGNFCRDVKAACLNFDQPQEESKDYNYD